jgi:hypothetical protein
MNLADIEVVKSSTIILKIEADLSEASKNNVIKPCTDKGAFVKWISNTEAVAVFSSKSTASLALNSLRRNARSISSLLSDNINDHLNYDAGDH